MKDRQTEASPFQPRIPLLSFLLHCISMPVVVFLRSGFGFAYLRPKSLFLACIWAFTLFCIYSWHEPEAWRKNAGLWWLFLAASVLYLIHLSAVVARQARGSASHDHHSGHSHLLRYRRWTNEAAHERAQRYCHTGVEPALVLLAGLFVRWPFGARSLSTWLLLSAVCLFLKEALNRWFQVRQRKRHGDTVEDAEESIDLIEETPNSAPAPSGRKEKEFRPRAH